jgi:glycosyltransferase involved in cell wall biosynthesis
VTGSIAAVMDSDEHLDVSVVLPVFDEVTHLHEDLARITDALDTSGYSYELVVIDDGSTDGSSEALAELAASDSIRLISFPDNRGTGTARRQGSMAALGDVIVWTDVDMTYPNHEIPALVKSLEGYDQVVGARTSEQGTLRIFRVPAKWFIRRLASYLVQRPIPDLNSGFRAFRADVADQFLYLLPPGFSCVTTITMAFLSNGYSVRYVPIEYQKRAGQSKFHWRRDTQRYLAQVVRLVLSYNPLRVFMPIGVVLGVIGMAKLGFDIADKRWRVGTNTLLVMFAALQVITVGLLADLMVRLTRTRERVDPANR